MPKLTPTSKKTPHQPHQHTRRPLHLGDPHHTPPTQQHRRAHDQGLVASSRGIIAKYARVQSALGDGNDGLFHRSVSFGVEFPYGSALSGIAKGDDAFTEFAKAPRRVCGVEAVWPCSKCAANRICSVCHYYSWAICQHSGWTVSNCHVDISISISTRSASYSPRRWISVLSPLGISSLDPYPPHANDPFPKFLSRSLVGAKTPVCRPRHLGGGHVSTFFASSRR